MSVGEDYVGNRGPQRTIKLEEEEKEDNNNNNNNNNKLRKVLT
jgi:hypothetical protein